MSCLGHFQIFHENIGNIGGIYQNIGENRNFRKKIGIYRNIGVAGMPENVKNCRPVSLLPIFGKIFERLYNKMYSLFYKKWFNIFKSIKF